MKEQYKKIKGFEQNYLISNWGRVVRLYKNRDKKSVDMMQVKWRDNGTGYFQVELWKNNKRKMMYVSRLVAIYFVVNPFPDKYFFVDHKDGNKRNMSFTNLEWTDRITNNHRRYY